MHRSFLNALSAFSWPLSVWVRKDYFQGLREICAAAFHTPASTWPVLGWPLCPEYLPHPPQLRTNATPPSPATATLLFLFRRLPSYLAALYITLITLWLFIVCIHISFLLLNGEVHREGTPFRLAFPSVPKFIGQNPYIYIKLNCIVSCKNILHLHLFQSFISPYYEVRKYWNGAWFNGKIMRAKVSKLKATAPSLLLISCLGLATAQHQS